MKSPMELTQYWLKSIVIDFDLCPFARKPFEMGLVKTTVSEASDEDGVMQDFFHELDIFNDAGPEETATTLIAFPQFIISFQHFNDFVGEIEDILADNELDQHFQLVMFHPQFTFAEIDSSSADHYINRSPYPTIQIIRSADLAAARMSPAQAEELSRLNGDKFRRLSPEALKNLFYYLTE